MTATTKPSEPTEAQRLSVIIPVYRDTAALQRLLTLLSRDPGIDECLVAAANTEQSELETAVAGRATIIRSEAGRGRQLNAGAASASGTLLWFLHADATPPADAASAIRGHIGAGNDGGWFQFRFEGVEGRSARRLAALINWRARRGVAYGDQGLFFTREAFERWGGFEPAPLFEEVRLVRAAKTEGAFTALPLEIGVDPRKWRETGWLRRTLVNRALALGHAAGISSERLARWYRRW
ncbi:MAG: TIGR04283 family arsenosugar biosynthesis glycosyltransferase [Pseudomonadota bacterium]